MERMMQMASAEWMMDLAIKVNNLHGFVTGAETYSGAAWNKIGRIEYPATDTLFATYKADKDKFWGDLYRYWFPEENSL